MKSYLGEFEGVVLLTIVMLDDQAYVVVIKEDIEEEVNCTITSLQSTIEKGLLTSSLRITMTERGGRRKRYFQLKACTKQILHHVKSLCDDLWSMSKLGIQLI